MFSFTFYVSLTFFVTCNVIITVIFTWMQCNYNRYSESKLLLNGHLVFYKVLQIWYHSTYPYAQACEHFSWSCDKPTAGHMWNVKCIWYGFEIYNYLKTFHTNITTTNDLKKSSFVGCSATPGRLLDEVPVQSAVEGVVAPITRQTSLPGSPACNTRMRSWGTTSCRLCRTMDQGFCYSRTVPSSCFQSRCRMNSRSETSTPCPGQPFTLICHQLNMSGTSRKRRLQRQLYRLYRIFVKHPWQRHEINTDQCQKWQKYNGV